MSVTPSRGLYLYLKTVEIAMQDAIVTNDEATILHVLANALGVSPGDTANAFLLLGEEKNPFDDTAEDYSGHHLGDVTTYQSASLQPLMMRLFLRTSGLCWMYYGELSAYNQISTR